MAEDMDPGLADGRHRPAVHLRAGAGLPAAREAAVIAIPARTCPECGEFLPHACAPVIIIQRQRFTGRRVITITDRP
jgi:hypothetical protein